jgi:large subunit ribosomal protein L31
MAWIMKKDIHPTTYRPVVFQDLNNGFAFLTRSTVATDETIKWEDGNEYPLVKVHISSASHPFFTGEERIEAAREARAKAAKKQATRKDAKAQKAEAKKTAQTPKAGK